MSCRFIGADLCRRRTLFVSKVVGTGSSCYHRLPHDTKFLWRCISHYRICHNFKKNNPLSSTTLLQIHAAKKSRYRFVAARRGASGYRAEYLSKIPMKCYWESTNPPHIIFLGISIPIYFIKIFSLRFLKNRDKFDAMYEVLLCRVCIIPCTNFCQISSMVFHNSVILNRACTYFLLYYFPLL